MTLPANQATAAAWRFGSQWRTAIGEPIVRALKEKQRMTMSKRAKILVGLAAGVPITLVLLRLFGLIIPFLIPHQSMAPALSGGDHAFMEGFTYLIRKPQRGDVVVFRANSLPPLQDGVTYVKRVVGLPGERLRISDGKLYVDERIMELKNRDGVIGYTNWTNSMWLATRDSTVVVPPGHYFVLGDNSSNSLDSRFWGFLPAKAIRGRMWFCYWPPRNAGSIQ
jgi:signal peptidase I